MSLLPMSLFSQTMWYAAPAAKWNESLPVGNGRLGMMVYGDPVCERLAINESTLWSGSYNPDANPRFGRERLDSLRHVFLAGDIEEGNRLASEALRGDISCFGTHLPMGDIRIETGIGTYENYKRSLDMCTGIASTAYTVNGIRYSTEAFASNVDNMMVWHIESDTEGEVGVTVSLDLLREAQVKTEGDRLEWSGKVSFPKQGKGGVSFAGCIVVVHSGGSLSTTDSSIVVSGADDVTLYSDIRTDYLCKLERPTLKHGNYHKIRSRHIKDFAPLFARVSLLLGEPSADTIATDVRLANVRKGLRDTHLESLFFNYGRYLFLSASRSNSPLPVALQGMFNDNMACNMPWTNDYHLDINTEQNYWLSNIGNMHEGNMPLLRYIEHLAHYGRETASVVYGCQGWCAHTTANVFGFTAPSAAIAWGLFPTAGSWLATHLYDHYRYTGDRRWLHKAYPLLRENARFLLDYMVFDSVSGYLLTGPSISPENGFLYNGKYMSASMSPTVDRVLVYEILSDCSDAASVLEKDKPFADSCRQALTHLPPLQTGRDGGLQEWLMDYPQAVPNHRHTSHLLALFPFRQISIDSTPELAAAALRSLENRMNASGWEDTEWSRANAMCYYARLRMPEQAYSSLQMLLSNFTCSNMLTCSPAGIAMAEDDIFSFDGNTAGAAAIAEMLVQNSGNDILILPALPSGWNSGRFSGLCVHNQIEVDAEWRDRKPVYIALKSAKKTVVTVRIAGAEPLVVRLAKGKKTVLTSLGDI